MIYLNKENQTQTLKIDFDDWKSYPERAFLVSSHCNTPDKKNMLLSVLREIKKCFPDSYVLLCSHLPIEESVYSYIDNFIYEKNNPIINKDLRDNITCGRWFVTMAFIWNGVEINLSKNYLYHAYAHHINKYEGLHHLLGQKIKYAHVLNYDIDTSRIAELEEHYQKMKNDGKDVIYYDCESWLMQPSMNTEFFSLSLDSAEKSILKLLSYADYESVMDKTHEATYFNILKNSGSEMFKIADAEHPSYIGKASPTYLSKNDIDVHPINPSISVDLTWHLFGFNYRLPIDEYSRLEAIELFDRIDTS